MSESRLSPEILGYRKQRIVDAAARLFSVRPYAEVQMAHVAHEAKVAKPTLYRYFATKEELFLEALDGLLADIERRVDAAAADAATPAEGLQRGLAIAIEVFGQCASALEAVGGPESSLGERGRSVMRIQARRLRGCFSRIVERGIAEGTFAPIETDLAAMMILGAVRMTAAYSDTVRHEAAADLLGRVFGQGLAVWGLRPRDIEPQDGTAQSLAQQEGSILTATDGVTK